MNEDKPLLCLECTHDIDIWHNADGCGNACHCKLNKTEALYQYAQWSDKERDLLRQQLEITCQGLVDIYVADGGLGMSEYAEDTLKKIGMEHKLNGLRPGEKK